ncbi:hypothetical protein [Paraburkholderia megapolitana]|uniref:hypothetical protein n=1 Tax=Paraburkholderia megapolitana TaxID=420953 RepID=UPI0038BE055C
MLEHQLAFEHALGAPEAKAGRTVVRVKCGCRQGAQRIGEIHERSLRRFLNDVAALSPDILPRQFYANSPENIKLLQIE